MKDFYMLLNVFRKVTCFAKRNFYKGFETVAVVGSGVEGCPILTNRLHWCKW